MSAIAVFPIFALKKTSFKFLKETINKQLPNGIEITNVEEVVSCKKAGQIKESHFLISVNGVQLKDKDLKIFLGSDYFPIVRTGKNGTREINARPLVESMSLISPNKIKLVMRHLNGPGLKPVEVINGVFSLNNLNGIGVSILKTRQVIENA